MARERDLDLVEVAPNAVPPVCRILDYGKFKYEQAKKDKESRKQQHHSELREVRFKVKIDTHDVDMKARRAERFLREGDKVKMSVMFRGREITHPEIGRSLLQRVAAQLAEVSSIEKPPTMEGRFMNMILSPVAGAKSKPKEARTNSQRPPAAEAPTEAQPEAEAPAPEKAEVASEG
jgi:translation initiation factor IF-3